MRSAGQQSPPALVSALAIGFHAVGLFTLPLVVGGAVGAFAEVSEVADTAHVLVWLFVLFIGPLWVLQVVGILHKIRRERSFLRAEGRASRAALLHAVHRHVAIVTPRGWAVLLTGLWFLGLSLVFKWADLAMVAVVALLLFYAVLGASSFLSAYLVRTFAAGLGRGLAGISREMSPAVVTAGDLAEERFHLTRVPVPAGFFLLIEDDNPPVLGTESRYVVGAGASRGTVTVSGRFRRTPRGLHRLGPARIWYQDALGLTRVSMASLATAELKVLPRFVPLQVLPPPRSPVEAPDLLTRPHRFATEDYFRFKEYAPGDDTRRIQWRLSMRLGRLQVRQPESREISAHRVVLVVDTWMPRGALLEDAIGAGAVLDRLVETWISLAWYLVSRGDRVTLVTAAENAQGELYVERAAGDRGSRRRWQDLGARVRWQGTWDLAQVLAGAGEGTRAVVVSSRFHPPQADLPAGELLWVYLPPHEAFGAREPAWWEELAGPGPGVGLRAAALLVRQPAPAGADENGLFHQVRDILRLRRAARARQRLRQHALREGRRTLEALRARGDAVYLLDPGAGGHRLCGLERRSAR